MTIAIYSNGQMSSKIFGFGISSIFWGPVSSDKDNKAKMSKWDYIRLESSCKAKKIINKRNSSLLFAKVFNKTTLKFKN